jgi:type IV pilus biogenesis/stability protein PilW
MLMQRRESYRWWTVGLVTMLVISAALVGCGGKKKSTQEPDPDRLDAPGKIRLAQSYYRAGRANEAIGVLDEAIQEEPDNAGLRNFYGQVLLLTGRLDEARDAFRGALEVDPYLTDAHNNLGAVYDRLGMKREAEAEFRKALDDPSYPTPEKVYLNLGLLYRSEERIEEAVSMFRRAVEIDPEFYLGHYELASTLESTGRLEEAAREFEVAAPGYRNSGEYHYRLGFTYMRLGNNAKARYHLNRVIEVSPGSESAAKADDLLEMMN